MKKRNFILCIAFAIMFSLLHFSAFGNAAILPCEAGRQDLTPTYTNPSLRFNNVWAEHNIIRDGRKGMLIHVDININGMRGRDCEAVAYFYDNNGNPLPNQWGGYRTSDGNVATGKNFSPDYDNCRSRLSMFLPYGELHLDGTFSLKYRVYVNSNGRSIGQASNWETFRLTWRTNVAESDCPKCGC